VQNRSNRLSIRWVCYAAFYFTWIAIALLLPGSLSGDSLEDGARALARKVASSVRGGTVTFEVRNRSSLGAPEASSVEAAFQDELQRGGVKILAQPTGREVVLTISGNLTDYLGTAQVLREGHVETFIESLGHLADAPSGQTHAAFALEKEFLFGQDVPMLDVLLFYDAGRANVLDPQGITSHEREGDHWKLTDNGRLPVRRTSLRELRGYMYFGMDDEAVHLPGELCTASMMRKGWSCRAYHEHVPVRGVSSDILANKKTPAWVSAAQFEEAGSTRVVITGGDGVARLYEEGPNPVAQFSGWGSEIASLQNGCGNGWQLLVTSKTDHTKPDTVEAVEIQSHRAREVSPAIELPGPVIALHTPTTRSADNVTEYGSAVAIVRNLQTGRYEAYRLTISCGN
jgi:hypothetical protein